MIRAIKPLLLFCLPTLFCMACVQETHRKTITFSVDMRQQTSLEEVGIRGSLSPLSWDQTTYLQDEDNDSIFEVTLDFDTASNQIQFKFVKQDDLFELDCRPNRYILLEYQPETLSYSGRFDVVEKD